MEKSSIRINLPAAAKLFITALLFSGIYLIGSSGRLQLLINPRYNVLVSLSMTILGLFMVFLISELFSRPEHKHTEGRSGKYLFFMIITALIGVFTFSPEYDSYFDSAAELKSLNLSDSLRQSSETSGLPQVPQSAIVTAEAYASETAVPDNLIFTEDDYYKLLNKVYDNIELFEGKTLTLNGFVYRLPELGDDYFLLARFLMYCCAADASVIGFVCGKDTIKENFPENDWYEVTAVVKKETLKINGEVGDFPVLILKEFRKTDKPENPYVYPFSF